MGSSGSGGVDFGIGPIVWVRRRNGSWWPGKILGPDELSDGNLTSPRTGTPVKLLGREDASVDWYNLEKSKRVKAFRCGEFDDCIERAESAHGLPIKKREKYARREDAILHALELEKLLKKQRKFSASSYQLQSKSSGSGKEPSVSSDGLASNSGHFGNAKYLNVVNSCINVKIVGSAINAKEENQSISEDDHSEATPRMRGLQDFGLKTAPLKRKFPSPVHSDGSKKPMLDNDIQAHSVGTPSMKRRNDANVVEQVGSFYRSKRNRFIYLPSESNDSLDYKDPLADHNKTFSSELEDDDDHTHLHGFLNEHNSSSWFMEDVESDSSETESSDSGSDSSETEADMDYEMTDFQDSAIYSEPEHALRQHELPGEIESISSEEVDELAFSGEMNHFYHQKPFLGNETISKWQLKGKRNIRYLTKNSLDRADGKIFSYSFGNYHKRYSNGVNSNGKYFGSQMIGPNYGYHPYARRFLSKGRNETGSRYISDWGDMAWEKWTDSFNPILVDNHHFGGRPRSMLIDVDLKVQASYRKGVPIVSVMSKLDGKAIIGHPIQTEALEDGSSETIVSINDYNKPLPPSRRTNLRIQEQKFQSKKGKSGHKAGRRRKSVSHISRPPMDRKLPKKAGLSSNQKTRSLSSIAGEENFGVKMDGLIKRQTSGPTTVACIPVKLVFSRLLETIQRPTSKAALYMRAS